MNVIFNTTYLMTTHDPMRGIYIEDHSCFNLMRRSLDLDRAKEQMVQYV